MNSKVIGRERNRGCHSSLDLFPKCIFYPGLGQAGVWSESPSGGLPGCQGPTHCLLGCALAGTCSGQYSQDPDPGTPTHDARIPRSGVTAVSNIHLKEICFLKVSEQLSHSCQFDVSPVARELRTCVGSPQWPGAGVSTRSRPSSA